MLPPDELTSGLPSGDPILAGTMTVTTDTDRRHLARAIELAEQGRGQVSPNPLVGAVIADGDGRDRRGLSPRVGGPHAEVEAIRAAGERDLGGATLYVSLEPCCHHGRTPPCTEAIREAGIRRVVVASDDPTEHASRPRAWASCATRASRW